MRSRIVVLCGAGKRPSSTGSAHCREDSSWKQGEVREIKLGESRKVPNKSTYRLSHTAYDIPAPYHRIICQLVAEDLHGDSHDSHESRRRQAYAREVLDKLGDELKAYKHSKLQPADFRSKVLTPILQRQLNGTDDGYSPSVPFGIPKEGKVLTIEDVTKFYLQVDPTNPIFIHLGAVMGATDGSTQVAIDHYNMVLSNHSKIMRDLEVGGFGRRDDKHVPLLSRIEVRCIIDEGLEEFFNEELMKVVRDIYITDLGLSHHLIL
jgi:hypothetical protein